MERRVVKNVFVNDIVKSMPYKDDNDRISKTKELERNRQRMGIRGLIEDDERGNIIYSHRMEEREFSLINC